MWYESTQVRTDGFLDYNDEFRKLEGTLDDKVAKVTLAKFLRQNLGFTTYLLTKTQLYPFQEVMLKAFFNRNFNLCVWSRGSGKTFIAAVYAFLQCVFEPNTNVLVAGPTFRTARFIFEHIEKLAESNDGKLLMQCFGHKIRRNDLFDWKINGGSIKAIPLNGEKIRGFRANVLILDEFLLLPEELIRGVLMPFLVSPQNIAERIKIRRIEDTLIAKGAMKEEDRVNFTSNIRMLALSSASFTFEYLYSVYQDWINKIYGGQSSESVKNEDPELMKTATYFVSQLSWDALPPESMDKTIIEEATSGSMSDATIDREYRAKFVDGSASYFSAKKMHSSTITIGHDPHVRMVGEKGKKYILSIDPSFSNSPTSDNFGISLVELDETNQKCTLVHAYGKAGLDLKCHIQYFYYLLTNFNVVMILTDNADGNFIQSANESALFKGAHLEYKFFDFECDADGPSYVEELKKARREYNLEDKKICFKQPFTQEFIRRSNEHLQTCIDRERLYFASSINGNDLVYERYTGEPIDLEKVGEESIINFIDTLDNGIRRTKQECALIEVKTNPQGNQTFDLPLALKRNNSPNRPRKDNYTSLLLATWAAKCYFDLMYLPAQQEYSTFTPFFI